MSTEREKMLAGELYQAWDPDLIEGRAFAKAVLREINSAQGGNRAIIKAALGRLLGGMGADAWIEPPFHCDYGKNIHLGDGVFFNFNCVILDGAKVEIGARSIFGPHVQIYTASHPMDSDERAKGLEFSKPISIGTDVWVGGGAIILPGVKIGNRCVIGAGSVVNRSLPDGVLAAGNPCRIIRPVT
jgi:maltose O-acetyltransferase